ncbi:hypothetical protein QQM79_12605 [Marinobacteraceae bacterium S3BR75-40.1]
MAAPIHSDPPGHDKARETTGEQSTRQSLFAFPGEFPVSAAAVERAIADLRQRGYQVAQRRQEHWIISCPGTPLKIHRHSPAQLVHFAARERRKPIA